MVLREVLLFPLEMKRRGIIECWGCKQISIGGSKSKFSWGGMNINSGIWGICINLSNMDNRLMVEFF
jgi:hypothetical protein